MRSTEVRHPLEGWARRRRPLVVATLLLAGIPAERAARIVRRVAARGGDELIDDELERTVLTAAARERPVSRDRPDDALLTNDRAEGEARAAHDRHGSGPLPERDLLELGRGLDAFSVGDRIATLAAVVLDLPADVLPGAERLDDLAVALGIPRSHWVAPDPAGPVPLEPRLRAAADALAPRDDPMLFVRAVRRRRARWLRPVAVAVALALVLAGVGALALRRDAEPTAAEGAVQSVAVLAYAPGPFDLYPDAEAVGEIVGVYVFTDRWSCYRGWPDVDVPADTWFLGIAAPDRATLDGLTAQVDRPVLAVAEVRSVCLSPPRPDDLGVSTTG